MPLAGGQPRAKSEKDKTNRNELTRRPAPTLVKALVHQNALKRRSVTDNRWRWNRPPRSSPEAEMILRSMRRSERARHLSR